MRAVKFMWGLFACNELLHRRFGMGDGNCDHCQGEKETALTYAITSEERIRIEGATKVELIK